MTCYGLVDNNPFNTERSKVCCWCENPGLANHYKTKTVFYKTKEGHYHKHAAKGAASAAAQRMRRKCIPPWADREEIRLFYAIAYYLTLETGIEYEVDHIIPVNNPRVCGLHVPENLRVITRVENMRKGNKFKVE